MVSLEVVIPQLLSDLECENFDDALSITTKLLLPNDKNDDCNDEGESSTSSTPPPTLSTNLKQIIEQIHCRCLIALSKYTSMLEYYKTCVDTADDTDTADDRLGLEYVYALYKLGRYSYCRDIIQNKLKSINNKRNTSSKVESPAATSNEDESLSSYINGMMHILAQCQYRLHDTKGARETYTNMILQSNTDGNDDNDGYGLLSSLDDEILTNALATNVSNKTFIGTPSTILNKKNNESSSNSNIIENEIIQKLSIENELIKNDECLYELIYNAATQLMLQSTSVTQTKKAIEWFQIAEQKCIQEYEDEKNALEAAVNDKDDNDDEDDENNRSNKNKDIEQEKTHFKNIMPIQANIAFAKMQLGDINGSTRSYLELVLAGSKNGVPASTLSLAVDNNLAVLNSKRSSSSSVFDLMKRLPDITHQGNNGSGTIPASNPSQSRIILYNKAVLYHKMNKYSECKTVLDMLMKSLEQPKTTTTTTSSSNANRNGNGYDNIKNGSNGTTKKKRKKGKTVSASNKSGDKGSVISNGKGTVASAAVVETNSERILWESRIALLEHEIDGDDSNKNSNDIDAIVNKIKTEIDAIAKDGDDDDDDDVYLLEYALAEVLLYQAQNSNQNSTNNKDGIMNELDMAGQTKLAATLEDLPESIRSRPAVIATLYSIYSNLSLDDKVKQTLDSMKSSSSTKDDSDQSLTEQKRVGDFKLRLGMYEEAALMYELILSQIDNGDNSLDNDARMECEAGLMKAVSYFDVDKALEFADEVPFELDDDDDDDNFDGEELEAMEIPRLSKGTSGNKVRKMIGRNRNAEKQKKQKNHESILRRRAKKREAYLEKLQEEGRYNPDRPVKPDPERWVPKSQRSYNKRGKKGRTKFVGAQGIGSGAGAEKDAAKLDAAARAAAKAQGKDSASNGRSTAHLSVSSNGFKAGRRR